MSTVNDVKKNLLNAFAPDKLVDGEYSIRFDYDKEIKNIAYSVNLTPETIAEAVALKADILLTHHDAWEFVTGMDKECMELLKRYKLNHAFFHAPLDDAKFGTSHRLAEALGLNVIKETVPYCGIYLAGVVGEYEKAISVDDFVKTLEKTLDEKVKCQKFNDKLVKKVCITTGGGNMTEHIQCGIDENCDTYLTGEYGLYSALFAKFHKINLIVGSHTRTEISGVKGLAQKAVEGLDIALYEIKEPSY